MGLFGDRSGMEKNTGIKRLIKATGYSLKGIRYALKNEAAFRQEAAATVVLVPLAYWLDVTTLERVVMITSLFVVLIAELINSAIEAVVDRVGLDKHVLSGAAKDTGSAAVLLALFVCMFVCLGQYINGIENRV